MRQRERERGSEESNRQWIRVSYRGMKGSSLREACGAQEYLAPTFLSDEDEDDDDNVDEDENENEDEDVDVDIDGE